MIFISLFSIILYLKQNKEKENSLFRILNPTDEEIEYICKNSSYDIYNYYYQENKNIKEPKYKVNEDYILSLIKIIDKDNTNKKENIKTYLKHLIPSLIILAFAFISIIIWVLFIICGLCKNCKKCSCCLKQKCKSCSYSLVVIVLLSSFILSIIGILRTKKLFSNFDKISCSMLRFVNDITEGQTTSKSTYKWSGIDGINNLITKLKTLTSNLATKITDLDDKFNQINEPSGHFDDYKLELQTIYNNLITRYIDSVNLIEGSEKLIPIYIKNYGPENEANTILNLAKNEIETIKDILEETNNNVKSSFGNSEFSNTLTTAQNNLQNLIQSIDKINNDFITPLYKKNNNLKKNGKKLFKSFFIICTLLNLLFIVLNVCFFCECFPSIECIFKFLIHIIWNCLALVMVISFLLSGIFSIISVLSKDVVSVVNFSLSSNNLNSENPKIIKNFGDGKEYLDICINGNHNLMNSFFGSIGTNINGLLSVETSINTYINYLNVRDYPISIGTFEYNIYENDYVNKFMDTSYYKFTSGKDLQSYGNSDIFNPIIYLNQINSQMLSCSFNEKWMNSNICPNYVELPPSSFSSNTPSLMTNYFINLYNFEIYSDTSYQNALFSRYTGCSTSNPSATSTGSYPSNAFEYYFDLFQNLYINNKVYLNNEILLSSTSSTDSTNKKVKNAFSSIKSYFIATLKSAIDIIVPTRIAFENSVNGGNISTMLNCTFIKTDLIMLYHVLYNDLGNSSNSMSKFTLLLSFCLLFQILFTLISININNKEKNEGVQKKSSSKKGKKETYEGMEEMNSNNEFVHKKI